MSTDPIMPKGNNFTTGNEKTAMSGTKGGSRNHGWGVPKTPLGADQMTLGKAHCLGDRKGRFGGPVATGGSISRKGDDLRFGDNENNARFTKSGTARQRKLAGPMCGGGAGHSGQPSGHRRLAKTSGFAKSKGGKGFAK